jgi:hypothetical protein
MKSSRAHLVRILIGKSVIESVIVIAMAAALYLIASNRNVRGLVDHADAQTISGWAIDAGNQAGRLEVQLFIDDKFVAQKTAAEFRPDARQVNPGADDWHGFVFTTPALSAGDHEARIYVLHRGSTPNRRTLQLIGKPLRFSVASQVSTNVRSYGGGQ